MDDSCAKTDHLGVNKNIMDFPRSRLAGLASWLAGGPAGWLLAG